MDSIISVAPPTDPITAVAGAIKSIADAVAATMEFLSTPQGQIVVASQLAALSTIQQGLTKLGQDLVELRGKASTGAASK